MHNQNTVNRQTSLKTRTLVMMAILSTISFILMYIEMPIPGIFPDFLKIDISDIPAILGGMSFSPIVGVGIVVVKNIVRAITATTTGGVGEIANALIGGAYVFVICYIYKKSTDIKGVIAGIILGTLAMTVVGAVVNYFITLPFYGQLMGLDAIINLGSVINHRITDLLSFVIWMIVPFNILKGTLLSICSVVLFKKMGHIINNKY
ncbi:ECF transporter S component [Metaclostridioides mangenotii]|uniref:ECF transporter S component n=1 Tax=Metaclostridioides mangenotii TaxID=1540 RepID=UPI000487F856|nr:ECF transporter S component [Clostridioides mangenotii]